MLILDPASLIEKLIKGDKATLVGLKSINYRLAYSSG